MTKYLYFNKIFRFLLYTVLFHFFKTLLDIFLPNAHIFNRARGELLGLFFRSKGKRFALASGCIINCPWNLEVKDDVYIAHNCWLNASAGLVISNGVIVSPGVVLATTSHDRVNDMVALHKSKISPIHIGEGVWIASNSVITRGVTLGAGGVIGACSTVIKDTEPNTMYSGNPAVAVKEL